MQHLIIAVSIYLAIATQLSFGARWNLLPVSIWLPGIALWIIISLTRGTTCLMWAALLGFGIDCLATGRLGLNLVLVTMITCSLLLIRADNSRTTILWAIFGGFASSFLWETAVPLIQGLLERQPVELSVILKQSTWYGIETSIFAFVCAAVYRVSRQMFAPRQSASVLLTNRWSMLSEI